MTKKNPHKSFRKHQNSFTYRLNQNPLLPSHQPQSEGALLHDPFQKLLSLYRSVNHADISFPSAFKRRSINFPLGSIHPELYSKLCMTQHIIEQIHITSFHPSDWHGQPQFPPLRCAPWASLSSTCLSTLSVSQRIICKSVHSTNSCIHPSTPTPHITLLPRIHIKLRIIKYWIFCCVLFHVHDCSTSLISSYSLSTVHLLHAAQSLLLHPPQPLSQSLPPITFTFLHRSLCCTQPHYFTPVPHVIYDHLCPHTPWYVFINWFPHLPDPSSPHQPVVECAPFTCFGSGFQNTGCSQTCFAGTFLVEFRHATQHPFVRFRKRSTPPSTLINRLFRKHPPYMTLHVS